MIKISKIEVQKNNKDRVNIFVDDEYFASMFLDTAVKYGIKKDAEIDEQIFKTYVLESEKNLAFNKALNYINSAYKTTKQIRDYLNKKGYDKDVILFVVEKLTDYKILDDKNYALMFVETYKNKYGKNKLKTKLLEKGVNKNIIDEVLQDFESETEIIDKLLVKKIGNKTIDANLLTKCIRFLSGRGYNFDEINCAIKRYKQNLQIELEEADESWN